MNSRPQFSLFKRGVWINALLMSLVLTSSMCLSGYLVLWPMVHTATGDFASLLLDSVRIWEGLPQKERLSFEAELRRDERIELAPAEGEIAASPSILPYVRMLEAHLSQRMGKPVRVNATSDGDYAVDLLQTNGVLRARFPKARIGTNPIAATLVTLFSSFLLAWLAAWLATKKLIRPLDELARAAQTIAQGHVPNLPAPKVQELEQVVRNFNDMARDVRDLVERRNAMLAGISHDLRSPIARMRMALELARATAPSEYLDSIECYIEQMNRMIGEFLDFSRGIVRCDSEKIDLMPLLAELETQVLAPNPGWIECDPGALRRVLCNLLQNARLHGDTERPDVAIRRDTNHVEIDVLDRGPGIAEGDRLRLFEPFERGDQARSRTGTGLGLTIVRDICRAQGWEITLLDRPEGGLIARLRLRLRVPCPIGK